MSKHVVGIVIAAAVIVFGIILWNIICCLRYFTKDHDATRAVAPSQDIKNRQPAEI